MQFSWSARGSDALQTSLVFRCVPSTEAHRISHIRQAHQRLKRRFGSNAERGWDPASAQASCVSLRKIRRRNCADCPKRGIGHAFRSAIAISAV